MTRRWSFYMDFLPVVVIIGNEFIDMGLLTLFKAATLEGMNNHVFIAYAYAFGTSVLLPLTLFTRRSRVVSPPLSFFIICKSLLLGAIGMEKLAIKSRSSNAKVMGSIISIVGAFVLTFYNGPSIWNSSLLDQPNDFLKSVDSTWAIAGILLIVDYFLVSLCIIGATIISIGLYGVLWGKAKEEIEEDVGSLESPSTENAHAPLLQNY
ncbi:hypothetical protein RYX36_008510 [Vicia faba]